MRRALPGAAILVACMAMLSACGDGATEPETSFDLTFTGDSTFQGAHGGQTIHVGVFEDGSDQLVVDATGTVSSESAPTFEFTFTDALTEGESYTLDYWIDSNFGGGREGVCDSPDVDHQWRLSLSSVTGNRTVEDTHRPTETEPVCSSNSASDGTGPGY